MIPLDICPRAPAGYFRLQCLRTLSAGLLLVGMLLSGSVRAQDNAGAGAAQPPAPGIRFRERPRYPTDTQRLRRTVQIDGILGDGEWDPFYTVTDGPIKGTVYCNWDDNYLYLAARTEQPASLLFDLDMGGDGWLRGADNLEIVVGGFMDGTQPGIAARLLDAANSKDTPTWNETAVDPKKFLIAGKITGGVQIVEIAIPKSTASLVLRTGAGIGLRGEFLPPGPTTAYTPTQPFEPHLLLDASLVETRAQAFAGINPRLTISDSKCIPGQKLFATLELLNQTDKRMPIRSILWTGRGSSMNAVNTIREVTVAPLEGMKSQKYKYRTDLPPNLAPGSYTLTVVAETEDGKQVTSSASFAVVEPIQVQINAEPDPVAIVGQTKLTIMVDVFSAVQNGTNGQAELTVIPSGWEIEGTKKRGVHIDREDAKTVARFVFKLPSNTPPGDYPVEATVTWRNREWKIRRTVRVVNAGTPPPKNP